MDQAEARARRAHASAGPAGVQRMVNGARLGVLERYLGGVVKRYRDPGLSSKVPVIDSENGKDDKPVTLIQESDDYAEL